MNFKQVKKARELLGLSQTELAEKLGWKGYKQVGNLENDIRPVQIQTELAIKFLLYEANKLDEYIEHTETS